MKKNLKEKKKKNRLRHREMQVKMMMKKIRAEKNTGVKTYFIMSMKAMEITYRFTVVKKRRYKMLMKIKVLSASLNKISTRIILGILTRLIYHALIKEI